MQQRHHNPALKNPITQLAEINWFIVLIMTLIAGIGLAMMYSAGGDDNGTLYLSQQFSRFAFAFAVMLIIAILPLHMLMDYAYFIYFACLLVLVGVYLAGHMGKGATRWMKFGGLNLQPSEFMKLAVILVLARYFHKTHPEDIRRLSFLIMPLLLIAVPAFFIYKQPNLGTTIILLTVGLCMFFLAGVRWLHIISAIVIAVSTTPVIWHFMHGYQKKRVLTFLDPQSDPQGAGYNILQSIIAIGSGGLVGKGYLQGSQSQLNFLPEKHTDFIFTVFTEEFGFFGGLVLLFLYMVLLAAGLSVALRSRSSFGSMLAGGIVALLFIHILINCGMVMGLMPVVGVPLPLMSYGGSIMLSSVFAVGLLLNAYVHRNQLPHHKTLRM